MGQYRERIERGAAFLDEKQPCWRQRIDVDGLALENSDRCVLGQLDAWRWNGSQPFSNLVGYGFALTGDESASAHGYATLTAEWREYIRETRVGAGA